MENSTDNFGPDVAGLWVKLDTRMQMVLSYASFCSSVEDSATHVGLLNRGFREVRDMLPSPKNKVAVVQMAALHLPRTKAPVCCNSAVQTLNTSAAFSDIPSYGDFLAYTAFSCKQDRCTRSLLHRTLKLFS